MSARKNINWDDQPLGIIPDRLIAEALGVAASTVRYQRNQKGIEHPNTVKRAGLPRRVYSLLSNMQPWSTAEIGKALDADPARLRSTLHEMAERGEISRHKSQHHSTLHWALKGVDFSNTKRYAAHVRPTMTATYREAKQEWETSDPVIDPGTVALVDIVDDDRSAVFYCKPRKQKKTLRECITEFCEAHALRKKSDKCWGCEVGAIHRLRHCYEIDPTEQNISDMVLSVTRENKAAEKRLERALQNGRNRRI